MADSSTSRSQSSGPVASRTTHLADAVTSGAGPVVAGFVAPGGSGATELLNTIATRVTAAGGTCIRIIGRRLEADYPLGALDDLAAGDTEVAGSPPSAGDGDAERRWRDHLLDRLTGKKDTMLVVQDAQWLDEASLRVLAGVVDRAGDRDVSIVVAHRPAQGNQPLAALDAALARSRPLTWLEPLKETDVAERVGLLRGTAPPPALVEALFEQSAGSQDLVDLLLAQSWRGRAPASILDDLTAAEAELAPGIIDAIRTEVDQLPAPTRTALTAISAGADLDDDLLGSVADLDRQALAAAIDELRAAGLLVTGSDEVVPVVAAAVMKLTSVAERRRFHAALADALGQRGAPPTRTAEHLAAAGAQGTEAAATYIAAGDACLPDAPELARAWFDRAVEAGTSPDDVTARRAEAAALDGATDTALQLADTALAKTTGPDRDRALRVVAALLPGRGFWARAASAYEEQRHTLPVVADVYALIGRVVTGQVNEGLPKVPDPGPSASLEVEALCLMARGLIASLGDDAAEAEAPFLQAAELLESGHSRVLSADSPHALGATVALASCRLNAADHLLTRALERDVGGRALRLRHQLLFGWVALRQGRWSVAETALKEVSDQDLPPREVLTAAAIDAGLARRAGDLTRLSEAWREAEGALMRHPVDLLMLDILGELSIAAGRLGVRDQIAAKAGELGNILEALGNPALWTLPRRWAELQVALADDDQDAVVAKAENVAAVRPSHPRLAALATAAEIWVDIMQDRVEPGPVADAARGLQGLSLTWEASRLTGQAAIRATDPTVTRSLLEQARDLKSSLPSGEIDPSTPSVASILSEREQTVAQHIVDGLTYKEIGAQLYISPKTVEHHVAKIRQKLGASTRAEMLAALRSELAG